jgi:hypothetical protein
MTDESNIDPRVAAVRANLTIALIEQGTPPNIARHVAAGASIVSTAGSGCLIEIGGQRAVDSPESLGVLATLLVNGPAAAAGVPADDTAGNAAAIAAGKADAARARVALANSDLCFK